MSTSGPASAERKEEGKEAEVKAESAAAEPEAEKMLQKGAEEGAKQEDPEAGRKKAAAEGEQTPLMGQDEVEKYRRDPVWRRTRFVLFVSLLLLFISLVVAAVLIVCLSSKCLADSDELEALPKGASKGVREAEHQSLAPSTSPALLIVQLGESALFHCAHSSGKVHWARVDPSDEESLLPTGHAQLENGTLEIGAAAKADEGEYVCEALDEDGEATAKSESVKLVVHENGKANRFLPPKPPNRPRVDSYLKLATADDSVHFRCWMQGRSSDALVWRRMAQGQDASTPLHIERDGHSAFLIFRSVRESDSGDYECTDAQSGTPSSLVRLRVEPSRAPVLFPMEQVVSAGSTASFQCRVPGHPEAQLIWRRENGVEPDREEGMHDDGRGTLTVQRVRKQHEHMGFVCWAIYPTRADKQALSVGPASLKVVEVEAENLEAAEEGSGEGEGEGSGEEEAASQGEKVAAEAEVEHIARQLDTSVTFF